jgi:dihydrofolate reductase
LVELDAAIYIIVAMTKDGIIGKGRGLPWRIPEEMEVFKNLTVGNTVLMGRRTYEVIGHPLSDRNNIVISKQLTPVEGMQVADNFEEALIVARKSKKNIFIIGGAEVYKTALTVADYMYISWIHGRYDGDVRFPEFNIDLWRLEKKQAFEKFTLCLYSKL